MATKLDPWTVERARRPGQALMRLIDLERDLQRWIPIIPRQSDPADFLPEYELDGCTLIYPARADRTDADRARLIELYDDLWREQNAQKAAA